MLKDKRLPYRENHKKMEDPTSYSELKGQEQGFTEVPSEDDLKNVNWQSL